MDEKTNITITVIAGSGIIFLLIIVIILFIVYYSKKILAKEAIHQLNLKNKEVDMLRMVIETQDNEREKIAINLHDEVGPLLSTLKLNISKYKRDLAKDQLTNESLDQAREFIDNIVNNVRTASHDLAPQFLLKHGLTKALESFVKSITSVNSDYVSNIETSESFSKSIDLNVYRIALELINNSLKHDQPELIRIELDKSAEMLLFKLSHDKKGLTNELFQHNINTGKGLGLESIQSRLIVLNATMDFSYKDKLTSVSLYVPLNS